MVNLVFNRRPVDRCRRATARRRAWHRLCTSNARPSTLWPTSRS